MQTLIVTAAVAVGLIVGTQVLATRMTNRMASTKQPTKPNIELRHATAIDLEKSGYRFGPKRPTNWRDINLRQFGNDRGDTIFLRVTIAAAEASTLLDLPVGSRRPLGDVPPADWPRGVGDDPFAVPSWWQPQGRQSRCFESPHPDGSWEGRFASYDPPSETLSVWTWRRRDVSIAKTRPTTMVADELAHELVRRSLTERPSSAASDGSFTIVGAKPADYQLTKHLPDGLATIDAYLLPIKNAHRYLIALRGIDRDWVEKISFGMPLRSLPDDSPPPIVAWSFALPAGVIRPALPAWFTPGAGARWYHCLVRIGPGTVESGRWISYDHAERTLYLWDWQGPDLQPAGADLGR